MKKIILAAIAITIVLCCRAQTDSGVIPSQNAIAPYDVEVTFSKTVHILFPSSIRYVDLGSSDIIAGVVEGAKSVLRVKSSVKGFDGETNFSVITDNGNFYSFNAVYAENPSRLNIQMQELVMGSRPSELSATDTAIRMEELGDQSPQFINRVMSGIYERNASDIRIIGGKRYGFQVWLKGIYIQNNLMFFHIAMRNISKIPYDVGNIRFRITDKKLSKRTAVQETFVEPAREYMRPLSIASESIARCVFAFNKIIIPDDKVLIVEVFEKNGARHQSFSIENKDLISARPVNAK